MRVSTLKSGLSVLIPIYCLLPAGTGKLPAGSDTTDILLTMGQPPDHDHPIRANEAALLLWNTTYT
jgi:hypothetical protein